MSEVMSLSAQRTATQNSTKPSYVGGIRLIGTDLIADHKIVIDKMAKKVTKIEAKGKDHMSDKDIDKLMAGVAKKAKKASAECIDNRTKVASTKIKKLDQSERQGALDLWGETVIPGFLVYWDKALDQIKDAIKAMKDWIRGNRMFTEIQELLRKTVSAFEKVVEWLDGL